MDSGPPSILVAHLRSEQVEKISNAKSCIKVHMIRRPCVHVEALLAMRQMGELIVRGVLSNQYLLYIGSNKCTLIFLVSVDPIRLFVRFPQY